MNALSAIGGFDALTPMPGHNPNTMKHWIQYLYCNDAWADMVAEDHRQLARYKAQLVYHLEQIDEELRLNEESFEQIALTKYSAADIASAKALSAHDSDSYYEVNKMDIPLPRHTNDLTENLRSFFVKLLSGSLVTQETDGQTTSHQ